MGIRDLLVPTRRLSSVKPRPKSQSGQHTPNARRPPKSPLANGVSEVVQGLQMFPNLSALITKLFEQTRIDIDAMKQCLTRIKGLTESLELGTGDSPDSTDLQRLESRFSEVSNMPMSNKQEVFECVDQMERALLMYKLSQAGATHQTKLRRLKNKINDDKFNTFTNLAPGEDPRLAPYSHRSRCVPGTMGSLLSELLGWAQDSTTSQLCWLYGDVGTGKSAVARSFADQLVLQGKLGACFFYSPHSSQYSNPKNLFPVLAYQLATSVNDSAAAFTAKLLEVLEDNPDVTFLPEMDQLQKLILDPIQAADMSTIIIIDGLDELDGTQVIRDMLDLLSGSTPSLPFVRFFLTGKSNPEVDDIFTLQCSPQKLDIQRFLRAEWAEIVPGPPSTRNSDIVAPGLSISDIAGKADGSLTFASVILRFVLKDPQAATRLREAWPDNQLNIENLYQAILELALVSSGEHKQELVSMLELLAVARVPLSPAVIATMLRSTASLVKDAVEAINSILEIAGEGSCAKVIVRRRSFLDYIVQKRDDIKPNRYHRIVAEHCFAHLKQKLQGSICDHLQLRRYATNSELSPSRRDKYLDEETVYCCRYWLDHLLAIDDSSLEKPDSSIRISLQEFLSERLLLWFEVLSFLKDLERASQLLDTLNMRLNSMEPEWYESAANFVRQGRKLLDSSNTAIRLSARHIYHSALPFFTESEFIPKRSKEEVDREARLVIGRETSRETPYKTIPVPDWVQSLQYSNDGTRLAVGGDGFFHLIKIDEAELECEELYQYFSWLVGTVAYGPQGTKVAATTTHAVEVWDTNQTKKSIGRLEQTSVASISFHPSQPNLLLVGSRRGTIHLWDTTAKDGKPQLIMQDDDFVGVACWCVDEGKLPNLLIGLFSGGMAIWSPQDAADGPYLEKSKFGQVTDGDSAVTAVASSPKGHLVASGSIDGTVIVYDAVSNEQCLRTTQQRHIRSLQFSPRQDETMLVFTSRSDTHLCYIDSTGDSYNYSISSYRHPDDVRSAVFSPDGCYIATGADDNKVRIWRIGQHHWSEITCINVSHDPDGRFIVTGSKDKAVRVWDTKSEPPQMVQVLRKHESVIDDVLFLPNDAYIVSIDRDDHAYVWSREGQLIHSLSNFSYLARSSLNFPYTHGSQGFYCCPGTDWGTLMIFCWTLQGNKLVLAAQGSLLSLGGERIESIGHSIGSQPQDIVVILECHSGRQLWAQWQGALDPPPNAPVDLTFVVVDDGTKRKVEPKAGHNMDAYCRRSWDNQWILDSKHKKILWLPPAHRGWGMWDQRRLILAGYSGLLTVVDFEGVNEVNLNHVIAILPSGKSEVRDERVEDDTK